MEKAALSSLAVGPAIKDSLFQRGGARRTWAEIWWLDSPEIRDNKFSMFALRNCLVRTMSRNLRQGIPVNFRLELLYEEGSAQTPCGSGRFWELPNQAQYENLRCERN